MGAPKGRLELTWMGKDLALIPSDEGKYDYDWVDPSDPRVSEVRPILVKETVGDASQAEDGLLITGDSGHALRTLVTVPEWSDRYLGKVKLVYIDPPFNTEQAFEHYSDSLEHSIWLTLMRDRLIHLKKLLAADGSIWVHLDDKEVHRMRSLMDEVFGDDAFVAQVAWRSTDSSSNNAGSFAKDHNVILVYGAKPKWRPFHLSDTTKQGHYKNPNNDPRGPWYDGRDVQNPKFRANLLYDVVSPNGNVLQPPANGWRWDKKTLQAKMDSGEVYFNEQETALKRKTYLWEQDGLPPSDFWSEVKRTGSSRQAKNHLKSLFPGVPTPSLFDTPKPEHLLARILELSTLEGDIVLDCFGGSGATAAVAHKLNRRWVTIELLESTVQTFTKPRLEKVVAGLDHGGISTRTDRVAVAELPEGIDPQQAQQFSSWLKKFAEKTSIPYDVLGHADETIKSMDTGMSEQEVSTLRSLLRKARKKVDQKTLPDIMPRATNALLAAAKTRDEQITEWAGGGGFTVAEVGPSMYDVDAETGDVFLSDEATNGAWSVAVAGHLGYRLTPDQALFVGAKGRSRLAVVDGVVDSTFVEVALSMLDEEELVVIVGKAATVEAHALLAARSKGSKIRKAPDGLFVKKVVR